jgi:hypothetical protein
MYGALTGDICGSIYEWDNRKTETPEEIDLIDDDEKTRQSGLRNTTVV